MKLFHPDLPIYLHIEQDKIIFYKNEHPVLTALLIQPPDHIEFQGKAISCKFHSSELLIQPSRNGFDFKFDQSGSFTIKMDGHWFGQGELIHQILPLNKLMLQNSELMTYDNGPTGISGKPTPAWFSSNGVLVIAYSPVDVGINQPPASADFPRFEWDLGPNQSPFSFRPYADDQGIGDGLLTLRGKGLNLSVSIHQDAVVACRNLISHFGRPSDIPDESLFNKPTWTTWARYKTAIDQNIILRFADEIIQNGYPCNVLEIDDKWQSVYGDMTFNPDLFPDPKGMIDQLHELGFKVTAWVVPFFDPNLIGFSEAIKKNWLVKQVDGSPYLVKWWQGKGGLLDITNPEAVNWFFERLEKLQFDCGLDGFKFDAGEGCYFPGDACTKEPILPNDYTHLYVKAVSKQYELTEVRSGWKNQRAPIFFRQWDKASRWGLDNGLHSVLTSALVLGTTGYPFILPDMIGGNAYVDQPDAELMIRWTQLNALMPAMQFSLAPWDYGEECSAICLRYTNLHAEYAPRIIELARNSVRTGDPIIRPIWWGKPDDDFALNCDDQFLLGDNILVAPVLTAGALSRDIYLPAGRWKEMWHDKVFIGNQTLYQYPVPLNELPVFEKVIN